jgi:hypothetical protein
MRTDIENLKDGDRVVLFPNSLNPLHKKPITASFHDGYFYCESSHAEDGPDYYWRDVLEFNEGFEVES